MKVLLVDDDHDLTELLQFVMDRAGFTTIIAHDAPSAIDRLTNDSPDLAVVDVQLGGADGFHLLEELRKVSPIPVIMLSGRASEADKVREIVEREIVVRLHPRTVQGERRHLPHDCLQLHGRPHRIASLRKGQELLCKIAGPQGGLLGGPHAGARGAVGRDV
ncbi:MAG: response regulator, partial [Chloroflexota bacterium]